MSWLDAFLGRVVAPWWEQRDGVHFRAPLRELEESQWWPADRLAAEQAARLNAVLRQAFENVPFNRERLAAAGYRPEAVWSAADLRRLPVLEKADIRARGEALIAPNIPRERIGRKRTGGSTGVPLVTWVDHPAWNRKYAATWRANRWAGYTMGEKYATVWGNEPPPATAKEKIRRALYERYFALDTLHITDANMRAFLDRCARERPRHLMGHAHSIYILAAYAEQERRTDVRFDSVVSTAMVLLPAEREVIERAFHTRVFNRYGCEELSIIAAECTAHDGLHVHAEGLLVEILRGDEPAPPGSFGDLVITDLVNVGMPMLRYRIGDVAAFAEGPCRCGRTLPRLAEVRGRTADFLQTPDGERVFGVSVLDTLMIHVPGIRQAQLVQDRRDHILVRIAVDRERFEAEGRRRLDEELPRFFGPRMRFTTEYVERILPEPNGKYRFAICRIEADPPSGTR